MGADVFVYEYGSAINLADTGDTLGGFEVGRDRIWLKGGIARDMNWYMEGNYDGIVDGATADVPVLVWDPLNHKLWYDDKPQNSDGAWQGVMADADGVTIPMGDIFIEGYTVLEPTSGTKVMTGTTGNDTMTSAERTMARCSGMTAAIP